MSVSGGANRGHLPLGKVTYASVGPPCASVIRVSLRLDLPSVGPLSCECHSHSRVAVARFARTEEGSAGEGDPENLSTLLSGKFFDLGLSALILKMDHIAPKK